VRTPRKTGAPDLKDRALFTNVGVKGFSEAR
jgi:hypothetical protein